MEITTSSTPYTCARCNRLTAEPILPITRNVGQYFRKDERVLCWDCLQVDSNYVRDFGRLP